MPIDIDNYLNELESVFGKRKIDIIRNVFFELRKKYESDRYFDIINICCEELLINSNINDPRRIKKLLNRIESKMNLGSEQIIPISELENVEVSFDNIDISTISFELGENEEKYSDFIKNEIIMDIMCGMSFIDIERRYNVKYNDILRIINEFSDKIRGNVKIYTYDRKNNE